jgi:hypothetical protein
MTAIYPLLELRVDIHRHGRIRVADLIHDPLDVELCYRPEEMPEPKRVMAQQP